MGEGMTKIAKTAATNTASARSLGRRPENTRHPHQHHPHANTMRVLMVAMDHSGGVRPLKDKSKTAAILVTFARDQ